MKIQKLSESVTNEDLVLTFRSIGEHTNQTEENRTMEDEDAENNTTENGAFNQNVEVDVTRIKTETIDDPIPQQDAENLITIKINHWNNVVSENSALYTENKTLKESIQRLQNRKTLSTED